MINTEDIVTVLSMHLVGESLDYAVAKAQGYDDIKRNPHAFDDGWLIRKTNDPKCFSFLKDYLPSTNWLIGGPIMESEITSIERIKDDILEWQKKPTQEHWYAFAGNCSEIEASGATMLIAGMRCYVTAEFGPEIDIPISIWNDSMPSVSKNSNASAIKRIKP